MWPYLYFYKWIRCCFLWVAMFLCYCLLAIVNTLKSLLGKINHWHRNMHLFFYRCLQPYNSGHLKSEIIKKVHCHSGPASLFFGFGCFHGNTSNLRWSVWGYPRLVGFSGLKASFNFQTRESCCEGACSPDQYGARGLRFWNLANDGTKRGRKCWRFENAFIHFQWIN